MRHSLVSAMLAACFCIGAQGEAQDVSSATLAQWLCRNLGPAMGSRLNTFPGATDGNVQYRTQSEKAIRLRSGRMLGGDDTEHIWTYETRAFTLQFKYDVKNSGKYSGEKSSYSLKIKAKKCRDRGISVPCGFIFPSEDVAREWLSVFGAVTWDETYEDRLVAQIWNSTYGYHGWEVLVGVEDQRVDISWMDPEDFAGRRFCQAR